LPGESAARVSRVSSFQSSLLYAHVHARADRGRTLVTLVTFVGVPVRHAADVRDSATDLALVEDLEWIAVDGGARGERLNRGAHGGPVDPTDAHLSIRGIAYT
jgi:hypothetical protein